MIKRMTKKEILLRLKKLEFAAPTDSPYIIFFNYLSDGTLEKIDNNRLVTKSPTNPVKSTLQ